MLAALSAWASKYLAPAILGWLAGIISKWWHELLMKQKNAEAAKKAIDDAKNSDSTSGLFK